jgi:hypothetical protein
MIVPITLAILVRAQWAQVAAPLFLMGLMVAYPVLYYPTLK